MESKQNKISPQKKALKELLQVIWDKLKYLEPDVKNYKVVKRATKL